MSVRDVVSDAFLISFMRRSNSSLLGVASLASKCRLFHTMIGLLPGFSARTIQQILHLV